MEKMNPPRRPGYYTDEEEAYTAAMLADIKKLLSNSTLKKKGNQQEPQQPKKSPYDVMTAEMRKKINKDALVKKQKRDKLLAKEPTTEDLLYHYGNQFSEEKRQRQEALELAMKTGGKLPPTSSEIQIKSINMPFTDTIMKVQETLKLIDHVEELKETLENSRTISPIVPPQKGKRKSSAAAGAVDRKIRSSKSFSSLPSPSLNLSASSSSSSSSSSSTSKSFSSGAPPPPLPVPVMQEPTQQFQNSLTSAMPPRPSSPTATIASTVGGSSQSTATTTFMHFTADHLRKRYPRFTKTINFTDADMYAIRPRSNAWMVRFMEECYDEALINCCTSVSETRRRKRCGLELGAMESFPLVTRRLLERQFSTLSTLVQKSLEILYSLELAIAEGESIEISNRDELYINGGRCQLFARFLSEEYDLAYLALFLHGRDVFQNFLGLKLKDFNHVRIWSERDSDEKNDTSHELEVLKKKQEGIRSKRTINDVNNDNLKGNSNGGVNGVQVIVAVSDKHTRKHQKASNESLEKTKKERECSIYWLPLSSESLIPDHFNPQQQDQALSTTASSQEFTKIVPITLPSTMRFVPDLTMIEAPALGFDISMLPSICTAILPKASLKLRTLLSESVLESLGALIVDGFKRQGLGIGKDAISLDIERYKVGLKIKGLHVVPVYTLLEKLVDLWRTVPVEAKRGMGALGQSLASLRALNTIYDNNCEKLTEMTKRIFDTEAELNNTIAVILRLEKGIRRLERKWNDNIANMDELFELQKLRVDLTEAKAEKMSIESKLNTLYKKRVADNNDIETLWNDAVAVDTITSSDEPEDPSDYLVRLLAEGTAEVEMSWRVDVKSILETAIRYHNDIKVAFQKRRDERIKAEKKMSDGDHDDASQADNLQPSSLADSKTISSSETAAAAVPPPPKTEFELIMESLEKDAHELAFIGAQEAIELGLVPPHIREQQERERQELERQRIQKEEDAKREAMEMEFFALEDMESEKLRAEFLRAQALALALEQELKQRQQEQLRRIQEELLHRLETISSFAKSEIEKLTHNAVVEMTQVAVVKYLDDIYQRKMQQEMEERQRQRQIEIENENRRLMEIRMQRERLENAAKLMASTEITNVISMAIQESVIEAFKQAEQQAALLVAQRIEEERRRRLELISSMAVENVKDTLNEAVVVAVAKIEDAILEDFFRQMEESQVREHRRVVSILLEEMVELVDSRILLEMKRIQQEKEEEEERERKRIEEEEEKERLRVEEEEKKLNILIDSMASEATNVSLQVICDELFDEGQRAHQFQVIKSVRASDAELDLMRREEITMQEYNMALSKLKAEQEAAIASYESELKRQEEMCVAHAEETILAETFYTIAFFEMNKAIQNMSRDPWSNLDFWPESWLTPKQLATIEEMHHRSIFNRKMRLKRFHFSIFKVFWSMKQLRKSQAKRQQLQCLLWWRTLQQERETERKAIFILSRTARNCLEKWKRKRFVAKLHSDHKKAVEFESMQIRKRAKEKYLSYWRYLRQTTVKSRQVVEALKERRFIILFYTWKLRYRQRVERRGALSSHRELSCVMIQCLARQVAAKRRVRIRRAQVKVIRFFKVLAAKRAFRKKLVHIRRIDELYWSLYLRRHVFTQSRFMKIWHRKYRLKMGMIRATIAHSNLSTRTLFRYWKAVSAEWASHRRVCATKIQSTVRMWIVHRYVLKYSRWRRGVVRLQACMRRKKMAPELAWRMFYYKTTKKIQRLWRGYSVRNRMTIMRIADLHYAAAMNKYERLNYYITKYPELISELDTEGNTALHNAAKNASKRTLKLLLKFKLDPNAYNLAGYTPLHLIIMSAAVNRDEVFMYMLDGKGFDDDLLTRDGRSSLSLAVEYGRGVIASRLLLDGADPNIPDPNGSTCLQKACTRGYLPLVQALIDNGADVNLPGYCGTSPLHDCIASGNIDIAYLLFHNGAYINVYEPYYYQTPLMWACSAGLVEFARLFLCQGADVHAKDYLGWTCAHHAAASNSQDMYDVLREGDANFDEVDNDGNSPLITAVESGSAIYAQALLEGCCLVSLQNNQGNQAAHIAARDNRVDILKVICRYDEHIGRVNYQHETPLGLAKFHGAREAQDFLEYHYRVVEVEDGSGRNKVGNIWWDKEIDEKVLNDWTLHVSPMGERVYINKVTGERRHLPPSIPQYELVAAAASYAELPLRKKITIVKEENSTHKHGYLQEYQESMQEINAARLLHISQKVIAKFMRRKLAYKQLRRLKLEQAKKKIIAKFLKRRGPPFMRYRREVARIMSSKISATWRGYILRKTFYEPGGRYEYLLDRRARLRLRLRCWRAWRLYKIRKYINVLEIAMNPPVTLSQWGRVVEEAIHPKRVVGVIEEYHWPNMVPTISFYRHKLTGECYFAKPKSLVQIDDMEWKEAKERQKLGYTKRQVELTVKMQAMWRGHSIRTYYKFVERALNVSLYAQQKYMNEPDVDSHLYNYALHCHCVEQDYARARHLYVESLRRMEFRGPDVAFTLYSYSIFAMFTHEQDYSDVCMLLERARRAEVKREIQKRKDKGEINSLAIENGTYRYGKIYEFAALGFFRHAAEHLDNGAAWHNFALCRFLVFNDFTGSFQAFLNAFRWDPSNKFLRKNFDIMMRHYHGTDKEYLAEVVKDTMRKLAERDNQYQNLMQMRREMSEHRKVLIKRIQRWWRHRLSKKAFASFIAEQSKLRESKKKMRSTMRGIRGIVARARQEVGNED